MATLETLLSQQMIERLGWTLIHFVWQAAAVALLLAAVLRGLRRSNSNVRYVVACLAMVLIVALPLVTMSLVEVSRPVAEAGPILNPPLVMRTTPVEVVELPLEPFDAPVPETPERVAHVPWMQRIATALEPALPWLVLGWLLGVFGLSTWHLGGWAQLQRMKRRLVSEVAAPLHARAAELAGRLGIRRAIGLWASPLIDVPAVVGWIKPVILLPVGAVSGLSVEQLEAILAHELAHVRRCDYLVNLAQTVVEILGFYHPAVWWISHRIRDERENCCDDLAVQVCGDSRRYARALTSLEELRHAARASRPRVTEERARARCPRHTAVAASGGSLVGRIARLLGRPPIDHRRFAWLPGLIALLVVAAILIPTALVLATPDAPPTADTIASEPVSDAAPLEVTTQTLHVDQEQDQPEVLVNLLLFTNPMPNKIVDRETKRRIGDVLAPEIPSARQGVASMQNCTLLQILQTWVVGRTLTRHTMEVLVDLLQSRGYLQGEATPEILLTDNVPGHMNLITEELILPAQDPTSPPKPIALGTFVQLTPHVPPATSDRVTLEIGVEWKSRIEQSDPNNNPTFRSTEIASTVTVLRDHYFTLLAEPDDKGNAETGIGEFHLVMLRADLFEPDLSHATTAAAPAPAGQSLSRQVILDIQTVSVEKGNLGDGIVEWSRPQTSGWPSGILMGYTPDRTFTDALRTRLDELYARGVARRLAHQRLTTQEGYEARFKAVKEEWFSLAPAPAGNAADPGPEHTSIASGTIITATPTIGDANSITLNLNIEFSESLPKGEGLDLPIITRRTSRNVVTVRDGGTVLLAGLSSMISDGVEDVTILVTALLIAAPNPPTLPSPEANSTGQMGSRDVERTRFVHWDIEGQIDREFGFEQLIREEGDRWTIAKPRLKQSAGKMRCHVRADRGELRLDGALNQPTPDGGTFRGNVVIEITSSEPDSIDACTLYLDEVTFSAQNKRFTSSGPVRLVCGATELAGRGLELSFDEPQDLSDPSRLTVIAGVGVRIAPSGSLIVSLGDPQTEVSEASASTQRTPVGVPTETADSRTSLLDGEPRVMLDIEPSADAADRQVLLSFTIAEIVTEEALDRATARQLRALLTDASRDAKFNLPSVEELQKPVQYIVSKYANICNQADDAARAFTDLLVSRGYATVCASPEMLIRLGESGHLSCGNIPVMGPPAPPSQTDNPALSLDVTPTAPHDANGIRLTLALRARNLVSLDSKGRFSARAAYASFDLALSARNDQCVMLPLTTAVALDAKTTTTLLLVKPTLIEPPAAPALAPSASEQATADAASDFVQTDPMVRELAKKIAEVEIELLEAQQTFLPEHPEIVQKKQLLEALNTRLEERRKELEQRPDAGINSASAPDDRTQQRANAEKALAIMRGQVARVNERIDKASSAWYPDEAERSRELADLKRFKEVVEAQLQEIARIVEEQFGPPAEPEPYQLSETERFAERMKHLGLALRLYTENHDGRYPDDLLPLDPYLSLEDSRWIETSVIYLGKGKTGNDVPESPIAYDEMLLKQTGQTHVLFADGQIRVTPEGSSMIWLDHRKARASEASASRQPTPVRVLSETADGRASSPDEKPRVMLDIELVKFLTDRSLSPEAATQLSGLWDQMYAKRETGREKRGSLPRVDGLQISPQSLLERCTENAQGDSEALEILVDLLASREYLKVAMNPTVEVFDGRQAQVMSKQHVPNPTAQPGAPETVECRDLVTVTPRIDSAGHINLDLAAEICDVTLNDSKTPRISKYGIDTRAVVDKNKTFVCRLESAAEGQTQDNAVLYLLARPRIVPSAPAREPATVTASFVDTDLIEALAEISEQTQAKIAVDPTVKHERITARLSETSIDTALQTVLQDTASTFKKLGDTDTYTVFRPLSGTFQGTDLREALRQVAEQAGVNVTWDATVGGEAWAEFEDVSLQTALRMLLAGSPYVTTRTPDGYAITKRNAQPPAAPSREADAIEVAARFVLVDRACMEALRRGLPIKGVTAPADVNALHEIGSGLAEGRTPVLEPDRVGLLLKAVQQYAGSKMLAAPKVTVLDGESASVSLSRTIGYVSGYREPNDASQEPIPQHASKEVGVRLDATPHLIEDQNNIRLQFEMEIDSLLRMQKALYRGKYEYDVPTFTAVTTATEIVIPDGQTALIHVGETPAVGNILSDESEPAGPLLMLITPSKTPAEPLDPAPPMQPGRRPGDSGMGGLPPGRPQVHPPLSS